MLIQVFACIFLPSTTKLFSSFDHFKENWQMWESQESTGFIVFKIRFLVLKSFRQWCITIGNIWKKRLSLISFSFKPCAPFYKQQVSLKPMEQTLLLMVMRRLQNLSGRQNSQWCKCKDVEFLKLEPLATSQSCQTSFIRPSGRAGVASLPDSTSPVNTGWIIPMKGSSEAEKRDKLLIFLYYLLQCFSVCGG